MKKFNILIKGICCTFLMISSVVMSSEWSDISEYFTIDVSRPAVDRVNRQYIVLVNVTNVSNLDIPSSIRLEFSNLNRNLLNSDGLTDEGNPYRDILLSVDNQLRNGESQSLTARFPLVRGTIDFEVKILKTMVSPLLLQNDTAAIVDNLISNEPVKLYANDGSEILATKLYNEAGQEAFVFADKDSASIIQSDEDNIKHGVTVFNLNEGEIELQYIVENGSIFENDILSVNADLIKFKIESFEDGYKLIIPKDMLALWSSGNARIMFDGQELIPTVIEDDPILFLSSSDMKISSTSDKDSEAFLRGYLEIQKVPESDERCLEYNNSASIRDRFCKVLDLENAFLFVYTTEQLEDPGFNFYDDIASEMDNIKTLIEIGKHGLTKATFWGWATNELLFEYILSKTNLYMVGTENVYNIVGTENVHNYVNSPSLVYGKSYQPIVVISTGKMVGHSYNLSIEVDEMIQESSSAFAIYNSNPEGHIGKYRIYAKRTVIIIPKTKLNVLTANTNSVAQFTTSVIGGSIRGEHSRTQVGTFDLPPIELPSPSVTNFFDTFTDKNHTENLAWTLQNNDDRPGSVDMNSGYPRFIRSSVGGNGGSVGIDMNVNIPVTSTTSVQFDVLANSRSVGAGCGWTCGEYPANVRLYVEDSDGNEHIVQYSYNYGGAIQDLNDSVMTRFSYNVDQGIWTRNLKHIIQDAYPQAVKITRVYLFASGWDFDGAVDNVRIYENSNPIVKSYDNFSLMEVDIDNLENDLVGTVAPLLPDGYRVADWNDLSSYSNNGNSLETLWNNIGQVGFMVTRNGDPTAADNINYNGTRFNRFYFAGWSHRAGQTPHSGFLSHSHIGQMHLGSWTPGRYLMIIKE